MYSFCALQRIQMALTMATFQRAFNYDLKRTCMTAKINILKSLLHWTRTPNKEEMACQICLSTDPEHQVLFIKKWLYFLIKYFCHKFWHVLSSLSKKIIFLQQILHVLLQMQHSSPRATWPTSQVT